MGDMAQWLAENWFNLFSSAGIMGGLWFTAVSLRSETKTRRVANLLTITANYREVWKEFFHSPSWHASLSLRRMWQSSRSRRQRNFS
jgi:hypothetical protein